MERKNRRNYYRILHVQPDAPHEVIKSSYRALMLALEMHPDHGGDHWNAALINEAYEVLSNPLRRKDYDREANLSLERKRSTNTAPGRRAGSIEGERCVFCGAISNATGAATHRCPRCRSPLGTPAKIEANAEGQRLVDRIALRGRIDYFTEWPQRRSHLGMLEDMSPNGIRFAGEALVQEDRTVKIESSLISATARVVYCRPGMGYGELPCTIGADFRTLELRSPSGTFLSARV
ncbi:MAG: J domain-containing protein [Gemmatimonadetes bacterium]|nr:J domain-containing protein [Gemmatimonadota bacterium]